MSQEPNSLPLPPRRARRPPPGPRSRASEPSAPSWDDPYRGPAKGESTTASTPCRLLLADDQVLLLEGLRRLLDDQFRVVGCVSDVAGLEMEAKRLAPDVVVLGGARSAASTLEALRRVRLVAARSSVVVLAEQTEPWLAAEAFRLGARGFTVRSSSIRELRAALCAVMRGERYLTPLVSDGDLDSLLESEDREGVALTPRECEVVRLTAEGMVMKEVGAALGISARTVAFHKYRAMGKVGARSSADLVRFAVRAILA